jgi:hypothetical protein
VAAKDRAAVERAGVDGAATPPKPASASAKASGTPALSAKSSGASDTKSEPAAKEPPSTEAGSTPSASSEIPAKDEESEQASIGSAQKGPRYDVKSMKKWVEQHPEEAAELRVHVFGADQDATQDWVKLQNKKRKMKDELRSEKERSAAETAAERAQAKADRELAESAAAQLRPIVDLWQGATRKDSNGNAFPDFDLVDAAFENVAKMPLDSYLRLRARRGVSNPEGAKMRAENARLVRELEALKTNGGSAPDGRRPEANAPPEGSNGAAGATANGATPAPPKVTAPAASADFEAKWGDDVPKTHKLRNIAGWAGKLDAEMSKYHDEELDEYSRDPEDVADRVLKRELAALAEDDDEEQGAPPARKTAKPVTPKRKVAKSAEPAEDEGPPDFANRERWALERAHKRIMESRG